MIASPSPSNASTSTSLVSENYPIAQLRMLDKTTARNVTFEAKVGSTLKFGTLYIRTQSCRKSSPVEQPESAAFLQIWEVPFDENPDKQSEWVFSGWMYASSPALSAMDHPVYDVWVIDCINPDSASADEEDQGIILEGEGELKKKDEPTLPAIEAEELPVDYD